MFKQQQFDRRKQRRPKRGGIKEELINRQVLVIHYAIGKKLLEAHAKGDSTYIEHIKDTISNRYDLGRMRYGEYLTWQSLLELLDSPKEFMAGLLEDSHQMNKYRRRTALVGVLTEQEREEALSNGALGTINDIAVLY